MKKCIKINKCLACGNKKLKKILNLFKQPLANSFTVTKSQREEKYPLIVYTCLKCMHLQLGHCVNPKLIYRNYIYVKR